MNNPQVSSLPSLASLTTVAVTALLMLQGCTTYVQQPAPPPRVVYRAPPSLPVVSTPAPQQVVSVYVDPPLAQPAPIAVPWAPPPLLVEAPPPMPFDGAVWVGGYWHWEGAWVWARGRWLAPPQPSYAWVQPYYENRDGTVIFITGHWSPPGVVFVPPPPTLRISLAVVAAGAIPGPAPIGPVGVFIPPPPGSRPGLIIPAPIGTPPAVVTSAPPVVNVGMRITTNNAVNSNNRVNNSVTNVTTINNVTNISRVTNVTIVAPAGATASGQPVSASVPAQAHLAAALPPVVHAYAPEPVSARAIPAAAANRAPIALPAAQAIRPFADPAPQRPAAPVSAPIQHPAMTTPPSVGAAPQPQLRSPAQPARAEPEEGPRERTVQARGVRPEDVQKARPDNRGEQQRGGPGSRSQGVGRKPGKGTAGHATAPSQEHKARQGEHER